jgi:hypothetical protein
LPGGSARRVQVERGGAASLCSDAPAGEGSGKICLPMVREQQAGRARGLRGQAEAARGERRLDLDRGQRRDQRAALQPFFQGPGGGCGIARLDDEEKRRVEAVSEEARSIRTPPFARGLPGEAPQYEVAVPHPLDRRFGDNRKGEAKRRGAVAIGDRPDLMQPPTPQRAERFLPPPERGRAGEGVRRSHQARNGTPTLPPAGRGRCECRETGMGRKGAGGAGRGRARCGGDGQRHGNLLERADLRAQMLNQDPTPCPACLFNASRRNEDTCCTAWNVVTHATDLNSRSYFVLRENRDWSQGRQNSGRRGSIFTILS